MVTNSKSIMIGVTDY